MWRTTNNKLTFVSYLFNSPPAVISNFRFQSPYWGSLLNLLEQHDISSNWLHLYISDPLLPTSTSAAKALTSLNQRYAGHQVHVTLDSFLSPKLIFQTLKDWLSLCIQSFGLEKKIFKYTLHPELWILLKYSFLNSLRGIPAMKNSYLVDNSMLHFNICLPQVLVFIFKRIQIGNSSLSKIGVWLHWVH